jgi:phosphohistidine swiveling domain-containing protein
MIAKVTIDMPSEYVFPLQKTKGIQSIGNKAENLRFLADKGFSTPVTYVCTWDAHARYVQDDAQIIEVLQAELAAKLDRGKNYAIRSSANFEDSLDSSFAGQFKSVLDVQGVAEILQAIWSIWATAQSPTVEAYLAQRGAGVQDLKMAIIIQEMVYPQVSGVAFSKNPITGLDEVVVEAVRGSGEALVQEGITPDRWINKWGTWTRTPAESGNGQGIQLDLIEKVVRQTKEIAKAYGHPVDLEWVYDGDEVRWVQLREITSLDMALYSNRISREVFPGIIKPLIWSVNMPLVNGAWVALLTELIGPNDIDPESLAGYFYSRAYFNMGGLGQVFELLGLPRETLELLMGIEVEGPERPSFKPSPGTYALLPRMLRFALDKARFARKIEAFLPDMEEEFRAFRGKQVVERSEEQLLDEIDRLYPLAQEAAYYNIVTPLLMQVYNRILKGQLGRMDVDFESFDLTGGMEELEQFEPNVHLARLYELYSALHKDLQACIDESRYGQLSALPGTEPLQRGIAQFLEQFGHLSDSGNDFSHAPWRENPDLVLQMLTNYTPLDGGVTDKVQFEDLELPTLRRPLFKSVYNRARRFLWYREAVSSLYTFGYGLFRDYFLALGDHFVRRGLMAERDDIFYLYLDEVREIVGTGHLGHDCQALVQKRKDEIDRVRDIAPPDIIYGDQAPPLVPDLGEGLTGIPTSRGHYTGPARILLGIQDLGKLQEGDVLVIPYSDVGWTPLFTKAGAVIAESGGLLSHSSIIAREYGIPAVVSVPGACRIPDGTPVTVDGYRGDIIVHEGPRAMRVDELDPVS